MLWYTMLLSLREIRRNVMRSSFTILGIVLLAFLFSGAVGVMFGFFPARQAALLNPIDALRHE